MANAASSLKATWKGLGGDTVLHSALCGLGVGGVRTMSLQGALDRKMVLDWLLGCNSWICVNLQKQWQLISLFLLGHTQ